MGITSPSCLRQACKPQINQTENRLHFCRDTEVFTNFHGAFTVKKLYDSPSPPPLLSYPLGIPGISFSKVKSFPLLRLKSRGKFPLLLCENKKWAMSIRTCWLFSQVLLLPLWSLKLSWIAEGEARLGGADQFPAVSLPVTVVKWLEEQEALLWKQLRPVQQWGAWWESDL